MIRLYYDKMIDKMNARRFCVVSMLAMLALPGCSSIDSFMAWLAPQPSPVIAGEPAHGEQIFRTGVDGAPPCLTCHQVTQDGYGFSLAPNLSGIAERAPERIAGMSAEQYLMDSILYPEHHVVSGYHVSMFADYAAYLSQQDIADLIAYLLTL
jgi:mono/diheme cytochrome c family protein